MKRLKIFGLMVLASMMVLSTSAPVLFANNGSDVIKKRRATKGVLWCVARYTPTRAPWARYVKKGRGEANPELLRKCIADAMKRGDIKK